MRKWIIAVLVIFCSITAVRAEDYNAIIDAPADDKNYGKDQEIDKSFPDDSPPNAQPDLIRVTNDRVRGEDKGVWPDPVDDMARLKWVDKNSDGDDNVEVKVEGREQIGSIYWIKVEKVVKKEGSFTTSIEGTDKFSWADVKTTVGEGLLVLKDEHSALGKSDATNDSSDDDTPTLYCATSEDDGKGDVSFKLTTDEGSYDWEITQDSNQIAGGSGELKQGNDWKDSKTDVDPGSYTLNITKDGDANFERKIHFAVVRVEFQNVWDRDLDPLNEDDALAGYDKCKAVKHDNSGTLDLDGGNPDYLLIEPAELSDAVELVAAHNFFGEQSMDGTAFSYSGDPPSDANIYASGVHARFVSSGFVLDELIVVIFSPQTESNYDQWIKDNGTGEAWFDDLPPVYLKLGENNSDPEPDEDECENQKWENDVSDAPQTNNYHYDASWEMRSKEVEGGHGHQACYDKKGKLIQATPGSVPHLIAAAGTADKEAPISLAHANADVWPFVRAAQLDGNPVEAKGRLNLPEKLTDLLIRVGDNGNLRKYYKRRPPLCTKDEDTVQLDECIEE